MFIYWYNITTVQSWYSQRGYSMRNRHGSSSATHKLDSSLPGQHYPCLRSYEKSCRLPYARECQIPNRLSAISDCALYTTNPPKLYHVSSIIKYYLNRLNLIFSLIPVLAFNDDNIMGKIRVEKDAFHFLVFLEFFSLHGDVISDWTVECLATLLCWQILTGCWDRRSI